MIVSVVLYSLVIGAVLGAGAWLADKLARRAGVPQRFVWFGAMTVLFALTVSSPWRGTTATVVELPVLVQATTEAVAVAPEASWWATILTHVSDASSAAVNTLAFSLTGISARVAPEMNLAFGAAWLLLSAVLLAVLLLTLRRLDALRRGFPRAQLHGMQVRVGALRGPAVYGVLAPEIVVPTALLTRSADEQQLVLAHENEHRRARDPFLLALTAILVALLPWHPFAWWCASRVRLATELDCDARVLRRGTSARRYGALLLAVADSMSSAPRARHALALLDSRRHLERRILAMTTRPTRRAPLAVTALSLVGATAIFAACSTDVPTAAQVRDADATTVVRQLGLPSGAGQIVYFVDGKRMADADMVPAEKFASIEVRRKSAAGEISEVHIRTTDAENALDQLKLELSASEQILRSRLAEFGSDSGARTARNRRALIDSVSLDTMAFIEDTVRFTSRRVRYSADTMVFRGDTMRLGRDSVLFVLDGTLISATASQTGSSVQVTRDSSSRQAYTMRGDSIFETRDSTGRVRIRGYGDGVYYQLRTPVQRADTVVEVHSPVLRGGSTPLLKTSEGGPLIIIDGVIMTDPASMNRIKPNDIESIEVIKGPAASKIYGARAAAGVIQIKTKP